MYAKNTKVTIEQSRAEIDRTLSKYGATQRLMGADDEEGRAFVMFVIKGRHVKLQIPLPKMSKFDRARKGRGYENLEPRESRSRWEKACQERWRVLLLLIKAKLEAVELGMSTFEHEFLADIVMPGGQTVHEMIEKGIEQAYLTGKMPPLLGPG